MRYEILDVQGSDLDNVLERLKLEVSIHCNSGWRLQGGFQLQLLNKSGIVPVKLW